MKTYYIYGKEVDKETYLKYENKKFDVDGQELSMSALRVWATSKEIDEELPEKAAAAREIYNEILRDIGSSEKAAPTKKTHKSFTSYIDELNNTFAQYNKKRASLVSDMNDAQREYDKAMRDTSASEGRKLIAEGKLEEQKQEFNKQFKTLVTSFEEETKSLRKEFAVLVEDVFRATPDKIDAPSMQLINSGIMNVSDLEYMAQQFRHNPAMLKVIAQHAKKMSKDMRAKGNREESQNATALTTSLTECVDPAHIYEGFDFLVTRGKREMESREISRNNINGKIWDIVYNEVREKYTNYFIQPDGAVTE